MNKIQIAGVPLPVDAREDFVSLIKDSLVVIVFNKSPSSNFHIVISLAWRAQKYWEIGKGKKAVYVAAFGKGAQQAALAIALLDRVQLWKSVQVFGGSVGIQKPWIAASILRCYLESLSCPTSASHCHVRGPRTMLELVDTLSNGEWEKTVRSGMRAYATEDEALLDEFVFPCRNLARLFAFSRSSPESLVSQVRAAGVRHSCDMCPHFVPENLYPQSF